MKNLISDPTINPSLRTAKIAGVQVCLPPNGRVGVQISRTFTAIVAAGPDGIARYKAMGIEGSAGRFRDRYVKAFDRFVAVNRHLIDVGMYGAKGAFGYRFKGQ